MIDALWGWPPPVLDPAGPYSAKVTTLSWSLFALGLVVTAIVVAALYVAIKGPDRWKAELGGERAIWLGGVAFPGVVLTGLLIWGLTLTASLTEPIRGDEMRIRVTGEMWWFRVQYLDADGNVSMEDANEIHIPVGVPVVLELESADVIHSFWVPHLSGKKDMIPGRRTLLRIEADRAGEFGGVCAEYCGGQHALMGFVTVAHDRQEWNVWLAGRRAGAAQSAASPASASEGASPYPGDADAYPTKAELLEQYDPRAGYRLFMDSGCAACHRIAGSDANGLAGPDLTYVGSRRTLGAGILANNRGTMVGWIGDSQSLKPGNRMPSYDVLTAKELGHIAAFLELQR
ncbi:cytochrome c oxidase subunit II [Croceicoccus pelagius]|uniref:Cytochrome c oxidase subunit II n=1 Tax=Croceicoccus pelagius TaxID=1703341 RepID=A0A916YNC0_9SPHN|nr:c-type cytochrome [Croceicoccus pelagius]GGD53552.1 cytochrome c oxidase subunit II [Croceicoccus pelagius]